MIKNILIIWLGFCLLSFVLLSCSGKNGLNRNFDVNDPNNNDVEDTIQGNNDGNNTLLQLTVGSYNLRYITDEDKGERSWYIRKDVIRKRIADHDFDVLGTQEGVIEAIKDITEDTPYNYVAAGRDDGKDKGETSAILYKKEKFTLKNSGSFWLSESPGVPSKGWDAALNRICTWVKLEDKETHNIFYYFNAHFDHKGGEAREKSAELILNKIKEITDEEPTFFTGDLNQTPKSIPIQTLMNSDILTDARKVSKIPPIGPEKTFYSFNLDKDPTSRIDYIFVTDNITVLKYQTIDDDYTMNTIASDHLPVLAIIKF